MYHNAKSFNLPYILAYKTRNLGQYLNLFLPFDLYPGHIIFQEIINSKEQAWLKSQKVNFTNKSFWPWWLGGRAYDQIQVGCHSASADRI